MSFECSVRESNDDDGEDNLLCDVDDPPLTMPTKNVRHRAILECNTNIGVGKRSREDRPIPTKSCWAPAALKNVKNRMVNDGRIRYDATWAVHAKPFNPENDGKTISFSNADAVDPLLDRLAALYEEGDPVPDDEENIILDRGAWERIVTVKDSPSSTWAMRPLKELLELYYESRGESVIFEQLKERVEREEAVTEEDNVGLGSFHVPSSEDLGNYLLHFVAIVKEQLPLALNAAARRPDDSGSLREDLEFAFSQGAERLDYDQTRALVSMGHRALDPTLLPVNSSLISVPRITDDNIQELVKAWCLLEIFEQPPSDDPNHISNWMVGDVTKMEKLFFYEQLFNDDISRWDVSKVTNMFRMFENATYFNQDIGRWDVSNVTNMSCMFKNATAFNQDIGRWEDVSNVTDMSRMFENATHFNQDIGRWDVSKVTRMSGMFENATDFNQDIGRWDVSNVWTMSRMFSRAKKFNQDIGGWDVSRVTHMEGMFRFAESFDQPIGEWKEKTAQVTIMCVMFEGATAFNQDIGRWDVSNVFGIYHMFYNAKAFDQDLNNWKISLARETDREHMFDNATAFNQNNRKRPTYPPVTYLRPTPFFF